MYSLLRVCDVLKYNIINFHQSLVSQDPYYLNNLAIIFILFPIPNNIDYILTICCILRSKVTKLRINVNVGIWIMNYIYYNVRTKKNDKYFV